MKPLRSWGRPAVSALLAAASAGCPGPDPVADTGSPMMDTGSPMMDTGSPMMDTGRPPTDGGTEFAPPTVFTEVVSSGFQSPTDAVSSPDGTTFYFGAFTDADEPAIFRVPAAGGTAMALTPATGHGLVYPSGLVLSVDGTTLFIADPQADPDGDGVDGAIFSMPVAGGTPVALPLMGAAEPNSLGVNGASTQLYFAGRTAAGVAAVLSVPIAGGMARTVATTPLVAPTGLYVDSDDVVWVLDHLAEGPVGVGVLFSITPAGVVTPIVSGVQLGTPGGVSLIAGGGTAVVSGRDATTGAGQLWAIDLTSMEVDPVPLPGFIDPAGLRTARGAGVFAMVDSEGNAIFRGE